MSQNPPEDVVEVASHDLFSLQVLLGGHGIWTPEIEREIIAWVNARPREIICRKCGLREQLGELPQSDF